MNDSPLALDTSPLRFATLLFAVMTCVLLGVACGADEVTNGSLVVPTAGAVVLEDPDDSTELATGDFAPPATTSPTPTATVEPAATSPESTPLPTATPTSPPATATATPTSIWSSSPTAAATRVPPAATVPRPNPTARPVVLPPATAVPQPTTPPVATAAPTPTTAPAKPRVSCAVSKRTVGVGEALAFEATSIPASIPVAFTFDHGDGTLDPGARSDAFYTRNGQYRVRLQWESGSHNGAVDCRTVTVLAPNGCYVSLGPADGLGWRCGNTFCRSGSSGISGCPTEAPHGCYIGQDGRSYCIDNVAPAVTPTPPPQVLNVSCSITPRTPVEVGQQLVYQASSSPAGVAVAFAFHHGDGTVDPGARSDAYYTAPGAYLVQLEWSSDGRSGFIDCGTVTVVAQPATFVLRCTISDTQVNVGEITVFRAEASGPNPDISVVFNHGDGTRDPSVVSQAYYLAPGVYPVTLEWQTASDAGTVNCGTVTVT